MQNKITDIRPQVKDESRFSVYINDQFAFGISAFDLLKFSLKVGKQITDAEKETILEALDQTKCQEYANALVCKKMYTEKELYHKLNTKGFSQDVIQNVIARLKEYKYVDDYEYTKMYIQETQEKYGVYKIKQKLYQKGIEKSLIDELTTDLENSNTAYSLLRAKLRGNRPQREAYQKYIRFLLQKGFSFEDAKTAFNTYIEDVGGFDNE